MLRFEAHGGCGLLQTENFMSSGSTERTDDVSIPLLLYPRTGARLVAIVDLGCNSLRKLESHAERLL